MNKHSPTPWRLDHDTIFDANGTIVHEEACPANGDAGTAPATADLEFIVQCVNRCHRLDIATQQFIDIPVQPHHNYPTILSEQAIDENLRKCRDHFEAHNPTGNTSPWTGKPGDGF